MFSLCVIVLIILIVLNKMADKKITDPTIPLATNIADNDVAHIVDVSDPTDDPAGTSKRTLFSLVKSTLKTYFDTLYSSYSEWATYTGTRAGGDLVITLGDYDDQGNGTKIVVDDDGEFIEVNKLFQGTIGRFTSYNSTPTLRVENQGVGGGYADISFNQVAGSVRNLSIPEASGTIALTSDIGYDKTGYTVGTLPTSPSIGDKTYVTDGTVVAFGNFGATVFGGGINVLPVFYNGTNWIIG